MFVTQRKRILETDETLENFFGKLKNRLGLLEYFERILKFVVLEEKDLGIPTEKCKTLFKKIRKVLEHFKIYKQILSFVVTEMKGNVIKASN